MSYYYHGAEITILLVIADCNGEVPQLLAIKFQQANLNYLYFIILSDYLFHET